MKKLIGEIRKKLRHWLGIEVILSEVLTTSNFVDKLADNLSHLQDQFYKQALMGIDVGFHEPTVIIVASHLGGGRIEIINTGIAKLGTLQQTIDALSAKYGIKNRVVDKPVGMNFP